MTVEAELLERPLPRPDRDLLGYASVRTLEALVEALLALEFLAEGTPATLLEKPSKRWRRRG